MFINFDLDAGFLENLTSIWEDYKSEFIFLSLVFLYGFGSVITCLYDYILEGNVVLTRNSLKFFFKLIIGLLLLSIVGYRIFLAYIQNYYVRKYSKNEFLDHFPVNFLTDTYETPCKMLEMFTCFLMIINIFNIFYFQFFEQVFLTFSESIKKFMPYLMIYFVFILAYATVNTYLFGPYIPRKIFYYKIRI